MGYITAPTCSLGSALRSDVKLKNPHVCIHLRIYTVSLLREVDLSRDISVFQGHAGSGSLSAPTKPEPTGSALAKCVCRDVNACSWRVRSSEVGWCQSCSCVLPTRRDTWGLKKTAFSATDTEWKSSGFVTCIVSQHRKSSPVFPFSHQLEQPKIYKGGICVCVCVCLRSGLSGHFPLTSIS